MTLSLRALAGIAQGIVLAGAVGSGQAAIADLSVKLTPAAPQIIAQVPRIGINLGGSSTWGAEQLRANVLKNPGFEAASDRTLVVVAGVAGNSVVDDNRWLGRPDGFWAGGRYDVRTGAAAGRAGRISKSSRLVPEGPGSFELSPFPAGLRPGDTVVVSIDHAGGGPIPLWWTGPGMNVSIAAKARPGSPGRTSAHLASTPGGPARLDHYLDMITSRAGKLLPVEGRWRLSFWARGREGTEKLDVSFRRNGTTAFMQRSFALAAGWRFFEVEFQGRDNGPPGPLSLSFEIARGEAFIDDASLGDASPGPGGFRSGVVDLLKSLRPGYLRDWQGQLGDAFANRVASAGARRPSRYRPGDPELMYFYSLPEFFALCDAVGAQPWVIAPPLLDDEEWKALGAFLEVSASRYRFREILLEFGNENWNGLFRAAGFPSPTLHAQAAQRAFRFVRQGAGSYAGIVPVLNAQFVNPASWGALAESAPQGARIAVAPYFLYSLGQSDTGRAAAAAFSDDDSTIRTGSAAVSARGRRVSVYEVNLHTTAGNADETLRQVIVTGAHTGPALARRLLQSLLAGVREQAVYSFAGFDSYSDSPDRALVRLWGITRDLAPGTLRPTGLAVDLLNRAVGGDVHAAECAGPPMSCRALTAAWFLQGSERRLIVVSSANRSTAIRTSLPCAQLYALEILDGTDPTANNERDGRAAPSVRIQSGALQCSGAELQFDLPAFSLAVVRKPAPLEPFTTQPSN